MRKMVVAGVLAALSMPQAAWAFDDPMALVEAIYAPYREGRQQQNVNQFYSTRLHDLFAAHADSVAAGIDTSAGDLGVEPAIDFNPFVDGQHALLLDLAIGTPQVIDDKALVPVTFHNFDQPTLLALSLVREPDGWKVDDVSAMGGEENWMLSWLLQFDPWGM